MRCRFEANASAPLQSSLGQIGIKQKQLKGFFLNNDSILEGYFCLNHFIFFEKKSFYSPFYLCVDCCHRRLRSVNERSIGLRKAVSYHIFVLSILFLFFIFVSSRHYEYKDVNKYDEPTNNICFSYDDKYESIMNNIFCY